MQSCTMHERVRLLVLWSPQSSTATGSIPRNAGFGLVTCELGTDVPLLFC